MVKLPEQGFFQTDSQFEAEVMKFLNNYASSLTYTPPPAEKVQSAAMQYAYIDDALNAGTYTLSFKEPITEPQSYSYMRDNSQKFIPKVIPSLSFGTDQITRALTNSKSTMPKSLQKMIKVLSKNNMLKHETIYFGDAMASPQIGARRHRSRRVKTHRKKSTKRHTRRRR